jgi:zinc protease
MNRRLTQLLLASALATGCGGGASNAPPVQTAPPAAPTTSVSVVRGPVSELDKPPVGEKARDVAFPPIARSTLGSGLELDSVQLQQLPTVQIQLVIKSGSAADPEALHGLSGLVAAMLKEGTAKRSSAQIAEAVDFLGAALWVDNDEETIRIHMQALSEHLDQALGLIAELAMRPKFSDAELSKLKKREKDRLALQSQNPNFLVAREFHRALYGKHPYAEIDTTVEVVEKVKRKDLSDWHAAHFAPNNAFLVVVGDVSPERAKQASETAFNGWRSHPVPETVYASPPPRTQREVILVDRPQSVQSVIFVGNLALERNHPDFIPLMVANQVLGGSAASRLFMDLREKQSLTYGAYSTVYERVQVAPFRAYASVRNEVTAQAMKAFMEHLDRIVREPAPAAELADAKRYLTDRFPLRIETPGKIASLVTDLRLYGFPDDYWESYRSQVAAIEPAQALAAGQRHVQSDKALIVVVGKAADIKDALSAYGPVTVLDTEGKVIVPRQDAPAPAAASPASPVSATQPGAH